MLTEDSPLVKVAGKTAAPVLEKNKGLRTVGDLLDFVPRRYLPPAELTDLSQLRDGEEVMVIARVARARSRPMQRRKGHMLNVVLTDGRNELDVTFFSAFGHAAKLVPGATGFFAGTVGRYQQRWQLTHPDYELFAADEDDLQRIEDFRSRRIPVYSATGKIYSFKIRRMVDHVLDSVTSLREPVPEEVRRRRGLPDRARALELVHRPRVDEDPEVGLDRLRYDEALVLQTILAQRRRAAEALVTTPRLPRADGLLAAFDARLPFELTAGQRAVGDELARELALPRPMHRLLQGEVGSGKTVVALRAMLAVVDAGGQAALLAPTEVLAAQHHRSVTAFLGELALGDLLGGHLGTRVALVTGSQGAASRRRSLLEAASGAAGIVVGTHALIQRHVQFADLALVVVDEQHRFGVEQRVALREKNTRPPHLLVMTATPIPRTVAMTVFGDMETSTLSELPGGRPPVTTHVVEADKASWVARTWQRVAEEVRAGRQAYVVCPRIGEPPAPSDQAGVGAASAGGSVPARGGPDDDIDEEAPDWPVPEGTDAGGPELTGVHEMLAELRANPVLEGARLGVLHGRLDADTREETMRAFHAGQVDVLVATTVIEVGVDVPNATVMVVVDADRFGVSQLHQLRGRVGRGSAAGLCLLLTRAGGGPSGERLAQVAATTDGFELARVDLLFRKEGDILGARQSGRASSVRHLRLGRPRDEQIIAEAREDASRIIDEDPDLRGHPALAAAVAMRLDEDQAAYLEKG